MEAERKVMKVAFATVCLLLACVSAEAQQRMVKVRLFWQHPPEKILVEPVGATWQGKAMRAPVEVSGASASSFTLSGAARISGAGFPAFVTRDEMKVESRQGVLLLTLTMPLEDYVTAVLQGESGGFKSDEALKSMAVAARTYAMRFGSRHKLEGFDFCDTTHCQDVRLGNESARMRAAVSATEGELLWFEGRPAATYYHRSCGGELEDASALEPTLRAPYLRRHQDDYCSRTDEWRAEIAKADLARALGRPVNTLSVAERTGSGRTAKVLVNGRPMSAVDFRLGIGRALGWDKIRSDLYQMEDRGDRIAFRGRGQGHGVGLCQTGADAMGARGKSYREILAYYYPGTALGLNAQGLAWEKLPGASVDVVTTNRNDAATLIPVVERAFSFAQNATPWKVSGRPQVKVYPTIGIYRDATGEPGWVAASTRGNVIRLQPLSTLQRTGALESTLRHEFLHMLIESQARGDSPLWLREGLAIYLSNRATARPAKVDVVALERRLHSLRTEAEMRAAYRDCASAVADAVQRYGLPKVLDWVKSGVPTLSATQ
ncbi:MAG TPA: SpoIID/LytB domain-containing protein [Terriglobales bacterium]|nr:SpoIID/LytB domain-containing protein [Terriglobales bacterium]